jgi:hypothetical protein
MEEQLQKTKEEEVLDTAMNNIDSICAQSTDKVLVKEYKELSKHYKKLLTRSNKILKINDKMQFSILNDNESLEEDKKNILKYSKKKILSNVSSQREIKEQYSTKMVEYIEVIKNLKEKSNKYRTANNEHISQLKTITRKLDSSSKRLESKEKAYDVLSTKFDIFKESQMSFESLMEKEIISVRRNKDNLVLSILGIENFKTIRTKLEEFTTEDGFVLGIIKYLRNSLPKSDTIMYYRNEMFYIIMPYIKTEDAIEVLKKLGKQRVINGISIALVGSLTYINDEDDAVSLINRCYNTYKKAIA